MKRLILLAPAFVLATACGDSAVTLQPGQWETTVQFSSIEVPGVPPEAAEQMKQAMTRPQTRSECITPEQAANPTGSMLAPGASNNCEFSETTFAGGVIRVNGTCQEQGSSATMSMEGSYTATTMEAEISTEVRPPAEAGAGSEPMRMSGTFTSRRTGDCPG